MSGVYKLEDDGSGGKTWMQIILPEAAAQRLYEMAHGESDQSIDLLQSRFGIALTANSSDWKGVASFTRWQRIMQQLVTLRNQCKLWIADGVDYLLENFAYSPNAGGRLVFIGDDKEAAAAWDRPEIKEIATWIGLSPQTVYNYRSIAARYPKQWRDEKAAAGVKLPVRALDAAAYKNLTPLQSIGLVDEYLAKRAGSGYEDNEEEANTDRLRERARAAAARSKGNHDTTGKKKTVKKSAFAPVLPRAVAIECRNLLAAAGVDTTKIDEALQAHSDDFTSSFALFYQE